MRQHIGIFGGSFNPPHNGHVEICHYLLQKGDVDRVFIVPCFQHPFDKDLAPFDDRLKMCRFAFASFRDKTAVMDIERALGGTSYTSKTVSYLRQRYPDDSFFLIIGSDTREEMSQWREIEKIRSLARIITIPRGPKSPIPDISSTDVRECIRNGREFAHLIPREVAVYIITHGLYA